MAMVSDMKNLCEDIVSSFDGRMDFLKHLTNMDANLTNMDANRLKGFKDFIQGIHDRQTERENEVRRMLGGFKKDRTEMTDVWMQMSIEMSKRRATA